MLQNTTLEPEVREHVQLKRVSLRNLSAVAYANGFTGWVCRVDSITDVKAHGFFDDAPFVKIGDHIWISAEDGGGIGCLTRTGFKLMSSTEAV